MAVKTIDIPTEPNAHHAGIRVVEFEMIRHLDDNGSAPTL